MLCLQCGKSPTTNCFFLRCGKTKTIICITHACFLCGQTLLTNRYAYNMVKHEQHMYITMPITETKLHAYIIVKQE